MLLLIDNFDSFTHNLSQYFQMLGEDVFVVRNTKSVEECLAVQPDLIVLSPGPGNPDGAGVTLEIVERAAGLIPILGVCLGHQSIAQSFGGEVVMAKKVMHGKKSQVFHSGQGVFYGLSNPLEVVRYHSLIVDRKSLPSCLEVTGETAEGEIMGLRHREHLIEGVQFHPESVQTQSGLQLLRNFLDSARKPHSSCPEKMSGLLSETA